MAADLVELAEQWKAAKEAERAATAHRLNVESQVMDLVKDTLPDKGTAHFGSLKIVTGMNEKWDQEMLDSLYVKWPNKRIDFPFKSEWKPDNKAIGYLREHEPELASRLDAACEAIPRKPLFETNGISTQRDLKSR